MAKKLTRSKDEKIIAGVLGGVSEYLGVEPTLVRILWLIALTFTGFIPGVVLYTIAALILPGGRRKK